MRWLRAVSLKLRAVFRRRQVEREMEAELAEHLESEVAELTARGVPAAEARRRALAEMGRMEAIREDCRDARGTAAWEQFKQDAIFGVRLLSRNRTFSLTALATMALGIGSTVAVFSVVDGILIRTLPFPAPERLFWADDVGMRGPFETLRANSRTADYAGYMGVRAFNVAGRERPERVKGCEVSANFFQVLGAAPMIGRTFAEGEDRPGRVPRVILSHSFWVERYGARPDVIGRQLTLDEVSYEIIGVMPRGFDYPTMAEARFWVPIRFDPRAIGEYWGSGGMMAIARLRPGVSLGTARVEMRAWIPRIRAMFPWRMPDAWGAGADLEGLQDQLVAGVRLRSLLLLGVVGLVLLIAVVNVANMMIGQTAAREGELTLRASLGATTFRLARQLLTEALVLAAAGGVGGTLLAFGELRLLKNLLPADTPRLAEVSLDGRALAFTAAVAIGSGMLFGLLPAWSVRRQRSLVALERGSSTAGKRDFGSGAALVTVETAFATMLLVGALLLLHSLWALVHVDPGFRTESVVTAEVSPGHDAKVSLERTVAVWEQIHGKLSGYPGVKSVAAMNVLPLTPEFSMFAAAIEDHPRPPQEPAFVLWSTAVTPEHLETLGIRLLEGRGFAAADRAGAQYVVLVSRTTARRFWPGGDSIGKRLRPVWNKEWRTVIGVVDDVKNYGMTGPPSWVDGEVYVPLPQAVAQPPTLSVVARVRGETAGLEKRLPAIVLEACANCAVSKIARMEAVVADAVETPRSMTRLVGGLALLALVLATTGIYGVVSHGVLRRTRELGIRMALGAGSGRVAWMVLASSLASVGTGSAIGLLCSWALARLVKSLLLGVAAHDPMSFAAAPLVLLAVAMLASLAPVWRAVRIDPARSLREG